MNRRYRVKYSITPTKIIHYFIGNLILLIIFSVPSISFAASPTLNWKFRLPDGASSGAVILSPQQDTVYTNAQNNLIAITVGDGSEKWTFEADSQVSNLSVSNSGNIYFKSNDGIKSGTVYFR